MTIISDPPLYIDSDRSDPQKYFVTSFLSPTDKFKLHLINKINSIFNNKINENINNITNNIISDLIKEYNDKLNNKRNILNLQDVETSNNLDNIFSKIKIQKNEFNFISRKYNYSDDELLFEFESYKSDNENILQDSYKEIYGEETNTRAFKVRCVMNDNRKIPIFKEKIINKYCIPVGVYIPWESTTINDHNYQLKDIYMEKLDKLMDDHLSYIEMDKEEFEKRKNQNKNKIITK